MKVSHSICAFLLVFSDGVGGLVGWGVEWKRTWRATKSTASPWSTEQCSETELLVHWTDLIFPQVLFLPMWICEVIKQKEISIKTTFHLDSFVFIKCTNHLFIAMALSRAGQTYRDALSVLSKVFTLLQLKLQCHGYIITWRQFRTSVFPFYWQLQFHFRKPVFLTLLYMLPFQ